MPFLSTLKFSQLCTLLLSLIFSCLTGISASALDLSLNNRQIAVINNEILSAHSLLTPSTGGLPALALSALFPWMESVEYLEVRSGANQGYWDGPGMNMELWEAAQLVKNRGVWEVRVGRDVFSGPSRIKVRGTRRHIPTLRIWCGVNDPVFESNLRSALAFRDVQTQWRYVKRPVEVLNNTRPEKLPHLVILKDLDLIKLFSSVQSYKPVSATSPIWLSTDLADFPKGSYPPPLAMDSYDAESALSWLLAQNPMLFDDNGQVTDKLKDILNNDKRRSAQWINSETPLKDLYTGKALSAIQSTHSTEKELTANVPFVTFTPPKGTVNVLRLNYATTVKNLSPADSIIAGLLVQDSVRPYRIKVNDAALPLRPETLRFFDAYERIARLAISGQMSPDQAVDMINAYVNEE